MRLVSGKAPFAADFVSFARLRAISTSPPLRLTTEGLAVGGQRGNLIAMFHTVRAERAASETPSFTRGSSGQYTRVFVDLG